MHAVFNTSQKHGEFIWKLKKLRGGAESSKWSRRSIYKSGAKDISKV